MYADLSLDHKILKDIVEESCKACDPTNVGGLRESGLWCESATGLPGGGHQ
jgi:hypothetical protein